MPFWRHFVNRDLTSGSHIGSHFGLLWNNTQEAHKNQNNQFILPLYTPESNFFVQDGGHTWLFRKNALVYVVNRKLWVQSTNYRMLAAFMIFKTIFLSRNLTYWYQICQDSSKYSFGGALACELGFLKCAWFYHLSKINYFVISISQREFKISQFAS